MYSPSISDHVRNFIYPYRLTPNLENGLEVIRQTSEYLSSIDLSSVIHDQTTKESILAETLFVNRSRHPQAKQMNCLIDKIIALLFIQIVDLQNEKFPRLLISTLKPRAISLSDKERFFKPFENLLHYHVFEESLIIKQSHLNNISDEDSGIFWETMNKTLIAENFLNPKLEYQSTSESIHYNAFTFQALLKVQPQLSQFNKKFTLMFQGNQTLEEHYEILLLCGDWFHHFFQSSLSDVNAQEIDLRPYAPNVMIFKHGFQELIARVKQEPIKYPSSAMQSTAFKAYFHITSLFTHVATAKEKAGKMYFLTSFQNLSRHSKFIGLYDEKTIARIKNHALNSSSLAEFFSKVDHKDLEGINQLTIQTTCITLPLEIRHLANLYNIELLDCDIDTLPIEISELKKLRNIYVITPIKAAPFALPENVKRLTLYDNKEYFKWPESL